MKDFLDVYAALLLSNHEQIGQVHNEFRRQCYELSVDNLLEQFVKSKATGTEKPCKLK